MPLRMFARATPLVLGAVAAAIWLRRRQPERPALPVRTGTPEAPPEAARGVMRPPQQAPSGRADQAPSGRSDQAPSGRFERASERRPVDIVTVVDDLLGAAR